MEQVVRISKQSLEKIIKERIQKISGVFINDDGEVVVRIVVRQKRDSF